MCYSCSRLTPGYRNLIRLGNGLLLSCPRPPPEGLASATKTRDVTSEDGAKILLAASDICDLLVGGYLRLLEARWKSSILSQNRRGASAERGA